MTTPSSWPVQPIEPLKWLNDRIEAGKPACYLRFNDGEAYSMFGMKKVPETNGEHLYTDRMRRSLLKTFVSACCESVEDESVLVGSWWYEDFEHLAAHKLVRLLGQTELMKEVRWGRGHIYHREEGGCPNEELLRFVKLVRKARGPKTLYGNDSLRPVAVALKCQFGRVESNDAGGGLVQYPQLSERLSIWCAGFPAKEWVWTSYKDDADPKIMHVIDAGSLFDGLVGKVSREWLKPDAGPHSKFYYGDFKKAVFGYGDYDRG